MKVKRCPIGQEVRDQDPLNLIWNGEDPFHGIDLIIQAPKGIDLIIWFWMMMPHHSKSIPPKTEW